MKKISKLTLFNQDIDTSFYTLEMTWRGLRVTKLIPGLVTPFSVEEIIKGRTINTYIAADKFEDLVHSCAVFLLRNPGKIKIFRKGTVKVVNKMQNLAAANLNRVPAMTRQQIVALLKKIDKLQIESLRYGCTVAVCDILGEITNAVGKIVQKRKEHLRHPLSVYISLLTQPKEASLSSRAYARIKSGKNQRALLKKFFWLNQGYIGRGLSLKQLKDISKEKNKSEEVLSFKQVESELKLTEEEKRITALARDVVMIKALRADARQSLHVIMNRIIDRLARELHIKPEFFSVLPVSEVIRIIEGKEKEPSDLPERWEYSIMIPEGGHYLCLTGAAAKRFISNNLKKGLTSAKEIQGQAAYAGVAIGRARLVFGPQHMGKVKKGDILISTATSPQLLPAMKKAGGFVTDVGGITSHAAIVSRELRVPCIVGTKIATQVLKDGDLVEVDANEGIVRKK